MKKKIKNIMLITLGVVFGLTVGVKAATTIASTSVTYGNTTVQAALDELISQTMPLSTKINIGDYVRMRPTSTSYTIPKTLTGYTSDQTINPSELYLWRVIDIRDDGTIEMVSEYVSSTVVYFTGQTAYLNFLGTFNIIAEQYENRKYTVGSRYIGFDGQTEFISDVSNFTTSIPWATNTKEHGNDYEELGGGDVMYTYDTDESTGLVYKALGTLKAYKVGTTTAKAYWLGSRNYSSSGPYWNNRYISASGGIVGNTLYGYSNGWFSNTINNALRPIVTLRPNITTYSGAGTKSSPWVLV